MQNSKHKVYEERDRSLLSAELNVMFTLEY